MEVVFEVHCYLRFCETNFCCVAGAVGVGAPDASYRRRLQSPLQDMSKKNLVKPTKKSQQQWLQQQEQQQPLLSSSNHQQTEETSIAVLENSEQVKPVAGAQSDQGNNANLVKNKASDNKVSEQTSLPPPRAVFWSFQQSIYFSYHKQLSTLQYVSYVSACRDEIVGKKIRVSNLPENVCAHWAVLVGYKKPVDF